MSIRKIKDKWARYKSYRLTSATISRKRYYAFFPSPGTWMQLTGNNGTE